MYQMTHYMQAVSPMFADLGLEAELVKGDSIRFDYDDDMAARKLAANNGYTLKARTITDETLMIDQDPFTGYNIPKTQNIQDHRPTQEKWARKATNALWRRIDADLLAEMQAQANSDVDDNDFGGTAGVPITLSTGNAADVAALAQQKLENQNVLYDSVKGFSNNMQLDDGEKFPVAAIPAEYKAKLILSIGFKNTGEGDKVLKRGFLGNVFGFNMVVSTALPFSFRLTYTAIPTDATTITIGSGSTTIGTGTAIVLTWKTGSPTNPGDVKAETDATTSMANLKAFLDDPFATISGKSIAFVANDLSDAQQRIVDGLSMATSVDNLDGSMEIVLGGLGTITVAENDSNGTIDRKTVHAIFGTSKSISVVKQRFPSIEVSAGPVVTTGQFTGFIARQFVAWTLYGRKVFFSQNKQLVDVRIDASTFTAPATTLN